MRVPRRSHDASQSKPSSLTKEYHRNGPPCNIPSGAHTRGLERWYAPRSSGQSGLGWFAFGFRFPQAGAMLVRVVTIAPGNGGRADRCPTRRGAVREAASGATAICIRGRGCRRMARRSVRIGRRFLEAARLQTTGDDRQPGSTAPGHRPKADNAGPVLLGARLPQPGNQ